MALVYGLAAECGPRRENAEALARHFAEPLGRAGFSNLYYQYLAAIAPQWTFALRDGTALSLAVTIERDSESNWWCDLWPQAGYNLFHMCHIEVERATEAGLLLYERLRSAPPFRYAIAGINVDCFREFSELDEDDIYTYKLNGLVLCQSLWERFGGSAEFGPFSQGYWWRQYDGEHWKCR